MRELLYTCYLVTYIKSGVRGDLLNPPPPPPPPAGILSGVSQAWNLALLAFITTDFPSLFMVSSHSLWGTERIVTRVSCVPGQCSPPGRPSSHHWQFGLCMVLNPKTVHMWYKGIKGRVKSDTPQFRFWVLLLCHPRSPGHMLRVNQRTVRWLQRFVRQKSHYVSLSTAQNSEQEHLHRLSHRPEGFPNWKLSSD